MALPVTVWLTLPQPLGDSCSQLPLACAAPFHGPRADVEHVQYLRGAGVWPPLTAVNSMAPGEQQNQRFGLSHLQSHIHRDGLYPGASIDHSQRMIDSGLHRGWVQRQTDGRRVGQCHRARRRRRISSATAALAGVTV